MYIKIMIAYKSVHLKFTSMMQALTLAAAMNEENQPILLYSIKLCNICTNALGFLNHRYPELSVAGATLVIN